MRATWLSRGSGRRQTRFCGGLVAAIGAAVAGFGLAGPARAATPDPAKEACTAAFGPEALAGVATEGRVAAGEATSVDIAWDEQQWKGAPSEVLACTMLDGESVADASARVTDVKSGGLYVHRFSVPGTAPNGARLCEAGAVVGLSPSGAPKTERVTAVCLTVTSATNTAMAAPAAPTSTPPPVVAPAPAAPAAPVAQPAAPPVPVVAAKTAVRGADAAQIDTRPLPRTGNGRGLTGAAGVLLLIGGFGVGLRRPVPHAGR
jgi:hypothetical protein